MRLHQHKNHDLAGSDRKQSLRNVNFGVQKHSRKRKEEFAMDDYVETPNLKLPLHNTAQSRDKEPDDVKKLREWQQQRLERRLRGDYESAVIHLSQVVCSFSEFLFLPSTHVAILD